MKIKNSVPLTEFQVKFGYSCETCFNNVKFLYKIDFCPVEISDEGCAPLTEQIFKWLPVLLRPWSVFIVNRYGQE